LDLSDASTAPDFTALSFYKIFGFPDLGALIVRKDSGEIFQRRKYFGGGTVDMVTTFGATWHAKNDSSLHRRLEDGTLPVHNIAALQSAFKVHERLYGSMANISRHANFLASTLRNQLSNLHHANGRPVCDIYTTAFSHNVSQGPVIAFNLKDNMGRHVSHCEVEKLGIVKSIQFRTGGLCNPGGVASHLGLSADEMRQNHAAGQRCGEENDTLNGKPTGAIRVSLGAMSSRKDVTTFVDFLREFYVDSSPQQPLAQPEPCLSPSTFVVESLSVFPIKSCAAFKIPADVSWEVGERGLAWDREWCLIHEGTNVALSQKRFPRMALLRPEIDLRRRVLRMTFASRSLEVGLDVNPEHTASINECETTNKSTSVCGEDIDVHVYTSSDVASFFTDALGVPCTLARFPTGTVRQAHVRVPGHNTPGRVSPTATGKSIALANESPILLVSRSSVNRLNEQIKRDGGVGKAVAADSFRGNIVVAEDLRGGQLETPYVEDGWVTLRIGPESSFDVLGPCQRCQMVCVDQKDARRRQEPFSTLAKTRRRDGRVWFGMHMCLTPSASTEDLRTSTRVSIRVGDPVTPQTSRRGLYEEP
jgi:molybdenum cofactor sulfurtransferase